MKIIFSRKGFDSSAGGVASPVFPSSHMLSLPIPEDQSALSYAEIQAHIPDLASEDARPQQNNTLGPLVHDLSAGAIDPQQGAHLDPDLNPDALSRPPGWTPLFGQAGAAQGHLQRQGVGAGDLFLFYGWFRRVQRTDAQWHYVPQAADLHVIYGWMQIETCWSLATESVPDWAVYHPHCQPQIERRGNNVLYGAAERLRLNGHDTGLPGAGLFRTWHPTRQLTAPRSSRSIWRLPRFFLPDPARPSLSFHANPTRWVVTGDEVLLQTVGRGQEFVFDAPTSPHVFEWLHLLFAA